MKDYFEEYRKRMEMNKKSEEERVRWIRHLKDIEEGKEDIQAVIFEKNKEIKELKERLSKYEKVD